MKPRLEDNEPGFTLTENAGPITHVAIGLLLGFPPCCVLRFAVDQVFDVASAKRRGSKDGRYVPCGIFHRNGEPWREPESVSFDELVAEAEMDVTKAKERLAGLRAQKQRPALLDSIASLSERWERLNAEHDEAS